MIPPYKKELHVFDSAHFEPTLEAYNDYLDSWNASRLQKGDPADGVLFEITPRYILVGRGGLDDGGLVFLIVLMDFDARECERCCFVGVGVCGSMSNKAVFS